MTNKEFSEQLEKRTIKFSIEVINLSVSLPNTTEALVIKNQLTKSGTSIGANYREANRSRSPKDFKIKISLTEASEAAYWLEIIEEINWINNNKINSIRKEANELLAIFRSICKQTLGTYNF